MSDFWSKVLAAPQEQPQNPTPSPPATQVPWWQKTVVDVPLQQPPAQAPQQHNVPAQPPVSDEDQRVADALGKTRWAQVQDSVCPNCQSTNYMQPDGYPRPICFDCGHPAPRQTGSDITLKGNEEQLGPVQAARQIASTKTNNYRPHEIFDRIG